MSSRFLAAHSVGPLAVGFVLGLACCGSVARAQAEAQSARTVLDGIWNLDALAVDRPLVQMGYFSSYDRTGDNDDGFKGTYSSLYELPSGEQVIVDLQGPGCLYTLWFTGPDGGYSLPLGKLRFYLDGEATARLECDAERLFSGEVPGFPRPLVAHSFISTGGNVSHVPIAFAKRLLITTERRAGFYNAYYHLYPAGTAIKSWTANEDLTPAIAAWNACGAVDPLASGVERMGQRINVANDRKVSRRVELASIEGAGTIRALRLNPSGPLSAFVLNNTYLQIWWDGQEHPSVDVPIGPFFGSGQGEGCVRSLPIGMSSSGTYYCKLPMPFRKSARIALECRHAETVGEIYCEIDVVRSEQEASAAAPLQFKATWRREWPAQLGRDFLIVEEPAGRGVYLGHTLIVEPYAPDNKKWWEGDLRIWADGRRHPLLQGTGHEDELLGGWSSRWLRGPYSLPLHGLPVVKLFTERADSQWNGAMSGYRFFAGGIPFRDGIRVSSEHGTNNDTVTNYAGVAYYYHSPTPAMTETDVLQIGDADHEQAHRYTAEGGERCEHASVFDADAAFSGHSPMSAKGKRGQASESFTLAIDPGNSGVLLRRLYHQSAGRHSARLIVDGQLVQVADVPESFTVDRWREQDIILPPSVTAGKDRLEIRFERLAGTWNAHAYTAYSLKD